MKIDISQDNIIFRIIEEAEILVRIAGMAAAIFGAWIAKEFLRWVIVVDDDIDIRDMNDINRAIRDRLDPKDDIVVFPGMGGSTFDPSAAHS